MAKWAVPEECAKLERIAHYCITHDGMKVYENGRLVITIPVERFPDVIGKLAANLRCSA